MPARPLQPVAPAGCPPAGQSCRPPPANQLGRVRGHQVRAGRPGAYGQDRGRHDRWSFDAPRRVSFRRQPESPRVSGHPSLDAGGRRGVRRLVGGGWRGHPPRQLDAGGPQPRDCARDTGLHEPHVVHLVLRFVLPRRAVMKDPSATTAQAQGADLATGVEAGPARRRLDRTPSLGRGLAGAGEGRLARSAGEVGGPERAGVAAVAALAGPRPASWSERGGS